MCTGLRVMEAAAWAVRQLRWHEQQPISNYYEYCYCIMILILAIRTMTTAIITIIAQTCDGQSSAAIATHHAVRINNNLQKCLLVRCLQLQAALRS
jgi:hypothetical protein